MQFTVTLKLVELFSSSLTIDSFCLGNLCELEASADSLRPSDSAFFKNRRKRVHKRQTAQNKRPNKTADEDLLAALLTPNNVTFVQRTWNNSVKVSPHIATVFMLNSD